MSAPPKRFWREVIAVATRATRNGRGKVHILTLACGHATERMNSRTAFSRRPVQRAVRANCDTCERLSEQRKFGIF